jgi:NAD(P)-dependent dehydrogenase (short-subunit alcohol dehydrogenase family)
MIMDRITTGFGEESTAAEVIDGIDLSGKRAIVTGASSGIGVETARALASAGADVTLAVRDLAAGERVTADIVGSTGNRAVQARRLDLADLESVAAFNAAWSGPLDILINNAGVMALPELQLTSRGWETQFAVNHLGHFALALGLHDALAAGATAADNARIVSLSSRGHLRSPVVFDDINFERREYEPGLAYGQSKTANILFAVEANRRWANDRITANAVHPGAIFDTNLSRHMDAGILETLRTSGMYFLKTIAQGAATSVLVAASPQLEGTGGRYFEDCNEAGQIASDATDLPSFRHGVAGYALDPANAKHLWDLSLDAVAGPEAV